MKNIKIGIYCIENLINNKKYIGMTSNMYSRFSKHKSTLRRNCHDNIHLQDDWNKYGEENFIFYTLEECADNELDAKEDYYINLYNVRNNEYGYNMKSGGRRGVKCNEEVKVKLSHSIKKSYDNPERRKIQSENALKQWSDPEIKNKIMGANNYMYGKHHTAESKKKMSEAKMGKKSWRRNTNPVLCVELNREFDDAAEAGKQLHLDSSAILKVCRNERKTCGGYHWKFIDKENNIG